ncbi:MAG: rhodanese-like domain-containing protein [Chthoniobacter sp.]
MLLEFYNKHIPRNLRRDLMTLWILATISVSLGFVVNQFRDHRLPFVYESKTLRMDESTSKVASEVALPAMPSSESVKFISLGEFQTLSTSPGVLVLDARPEIFHRLGHIPKALPLPRDDFETFYRKLQTLLEADRGRLLLVYCSGDSCEDSALVAEALKRLGFSNIAIFKGGWSEWTGSHLPEENS